MGGVLAKAVHNATGAVVRQPTKTPERVKAALENADRAVSRLRIRREFTVDRYTHAAITRIKK
ncbi:MAG: hypothetical protein K9K88_01300 [Desulfobacterales bacterium]|nr:hypothetical protein [Desulfobacterales bacterium]